MKKADIGLIGLAVMGENLVMNMESRGFTVAVYNRSTEKVDRFVGGRAAGKHIVGCHSPAELVEALRERRKSALVFYQFRHDRDRILRMLNEMPRILAEELEGPDDIDAWNAGEVGVLLAHPASTAYGLNLQAGGSHIIWFGLTWNYEQYVQANARLHRQGQKEMVIVHHLVSQGTRDADVMRALAHKDRSQQEVLESLKARIRAVKGGTS